jgi:fructan beta-fructosidase
MATRVTGKAFAVGIALACWCALPAAWGAAPTNDIVVADFEGDNYGDWKTTGTAFGLRPAQGTLPNQMAVEGFLGKGLVNSYYGGDASVGVLTSPPFTLERRFIHFLIGGGMSPGKTCMNLLMDGKTVRTATGPNDRPGGSERLEWSGWDVSEFVGKTAVLEIVDQATGGWGHISIDQIIQTERKLPALLTDVTKKLTAEKRYLNLPVMNGARKRRVSVLVGDQTAREFEIELADANPDFWVFLDLGSFRGQELVLRVDRLPSSSLALEHIHQTDSPEGAENLYREALRPQFHFSSRRGWNNDPNGLVFYKGEYHLYYQHNPYGWDWGNMHWGHAVSPDLVHWTELPIALYPRVFGDWAFSGSAAVDWKNTGKFKTGSEDVLVVAYTSTGRGECIAFSNDRGRTWKEHEGNPVVKHQGRDPRLLWHAPTQRWVMALYDEFNNGRYIAFYTSPDLRKWTFESRIEGFFECPDLFELPVDGDRTNRKWVLTAASSEYRVGRFDGRQFLPETAKLAGHRGNGFYAAQTISDIPAEDGRVLQIGWGQMPAPGMSFNQMMCFPCELTLRTTPEGPRLAWKPARELENLRGKSWRWSDTTVSPGTNLLSGLSAELVEVRLEMEPGEAKLISLNLRGVPVVYESGTRQLSAAGVKCQMPAQSQPLLSLHLLLDRTSLELFAEDGLVYMPVKATPGATDKTFELNVSGGSARLPSMEIWELKSAWKF